MISVYIASPYTFPKGKEEENAIKSFEIYDKLANLGFKPFAPLTSHYIHKHYQRSYMDWLDIDFYWLSKCDCLLRLPGKSKGADLEIEYAKNNNIPVFYSIDDLIKWKNCFGALIELKNYIKE
jgi:hypothetical protein